MFTNVVSGVMVVAITMLLAFFSHIALRKVSDPLVTGDDGSDGGNDSWKPSPDDNDDSYDLNLDATFDSDEDDGIALDVTAPTILIQSIIFP